MFVQQSQVRIWLCTVPTDMRKSFTGLSSLVRNQLRDNPSNDQLYVFVNRRRNLVKLLYFDRTGYAIGSKQLAREAFLTSVVQINDHVREWHCRCRNTRSAAEIQGVYQREDKPSQI